jgi:hypothetical protein
VNIPDSVNKVIITYAIPNTTDSISFTENNRENINLFREVLKERSTKTSYHQTGTIDFISHDKILLHTGFTITPPSCVYLIKDDNAWKLSYRAGMYLDYINHELLKNKK